MEDEERIENDIAEDTREEDESIKDLEENKGNEESEVNDVAEDNREAEESTEDLKKMLSDALMENAQLKQQLEVLQNDLNEAHRVFMTQPRESEEDKERTYDSINNNIKR